jgi:hypothetical protein
VAAVVTIPAMKSLLTFRSLSSWVICRRRDGVRVSALSSFTTSWTDAMSSAVSFCTEATSVSRRDR